MLTAVLVKQVPDTAAAVHVAPDGSHVVVEDAGRVMNPYDELAVEEALRLRERHGGTVSLITLGPPEAEEVLRQGLAMGADRAIRVDEGALADRDSHMTAEILAALLRQEPWDLVLCGKQAVDDDQGQVGALVAARLGWPQVMVAVALEVDPGARRLVARREREDAVEVVEAKLPAVVGAQRGLNSPRYPTLPNIMKARRQAIPVVRLEDLGLSPDGLRERRRVAVLGYEEAPRRTAGRRLSGDPVEVARELVARLHEEAQVL